jgi:hypothetical protein
MKSFSTAVSLVLLPWFVVIAGCGRSPSQTSSGKSDLAGGRIQPGGTSEESEDSGYLALKIVKVHEGRQPLEQTPWHGPNGDWIFLECEPVKAPGLQVVIGGKTQREPGGEFSFGWGRGVLAIGNPSDGARFVELFAKAFHQELPASHGNRPLGVVKVNTAVLGSDLVRDRGGGFKTGRGRWTATKWFLEDENGEAEVFFNYNLSEKRAEFSEKDEDYRELLVDQLVIALRDGPRPERTPENDPSLTLVGPRLTGWIRVAERNAYCRFTPDSRSIIITENGADTGAKLFLLSASQAGERRLVAQFEGGAAVHEFVGDTEKPTLLVIETIRRNPKVFSSGDPQRLWLVDENQKIEVPVRTGLTNWYLGRKGISPRGTFLALHGWITQPNKKRARVIYVCEVATRQWRTIEKPDTVLELIGWTNGNGIVLAGTGFERGEARNAYTLNPATGQLASLNVLPAQFSTTNLWSPGGQLMAQLQEKECLFITDIAAKSTRQFTFHPYDRRHGYRDSIAWAGDRYLVFQGPRTALIDVQTLKMSFPVAKDSGFNSLDFSPDFKAALGTKEDGNYLGRVELPGTDVAARSAASPLLSDGTGTVIKQ